jgi:hypothetical protein
MRAATQTDILKTIALALAFAYVMLAVLPA